MRLVIEIWITWVNKNILGYLLKYKFPLLSSAEQSGVQPYTYLGHAQVLTLKLYNVTINVGNKFFRYK